MIAQAEKEKLFQQIFTEYRESLKFLARNHTDSNSCEDLEQEIFMHIWRGLDRYQGKSSLKTWSYSIAKKMARKFHRTRIRAERGTKLLAIAVASARTAEDAERVYILEQFTRTLDQVDRTVLSMYLDSRRYQEISKATALDECALRMRVCRLKKQLSQYAENKHGSPTAQDRTERKDS